MHAARMRLQLQQGRVRPLDQGAIDGLGGLGVWMLRIAHTHEGLAPLFVAPQGRGDHPGRRAARSDDGAIGLMKTPGHHGVAQEGRVRLGAGREDDTGGVAVQPVDQARPRLARLGEGPQQLVQGMHLPSPALARQAGGLVERQDVGVLVDHHGADEIDLVGRQHDGLSGGLLCGG